MTFTFFLTPFNSVRYNFTAEGFPTGGEVVDLTEAMKKSGIYNEIMVTRNDGLNRTIILDWKYKPPF